MERGGSGKPAVDATGLVAALRRLDARDDARPVARLDRVVHARRLEELERLPVLPVRAHDDDLEALHGQIIASRRQPTRAASSSAVRAAARSAVSKPSSNVS